MFLSTLFTFEKKKQERLCHYVTQFTLKLPEDLTDQHLLVLRRIVFFSGVKYTNN